MEGNVCIINCSGMEVSNYRAVRVAITADSDIATRVVRVVERSGPGVTPVVVVDHEPDEFVLLVNPDSLPASVRRRLRNKHQRQ